MAGEKYGLIIEVPEKWYLMSDEEIYAWRVRRAREKGEVPPLTIQEVGLKLGREMAERVERAVLDALQVKPSDVPTSTPAAACAWTRRQCHPACCDDGRAFIIWQRGDFGHGTEDGWQMYLGPDAFVNVRFCPFCGAELPRGRPEPEPPGQVAGVRPHVSRE